MVTQDLRSLTLELLRRCPNRCLHCSSDSHPAAIDELPPSVVRDLLDSASRRGLQKAIFSGGEPLAYIGLLDVLRHARERGIRTCIYTSGSAIDSDGARTPGVAVAERLAPLVDEWVVSLHSPFAPAHDSFMGSQGSWADARR